MGSEYSEVRSYLDGIKAETKTNAIKWNSAFLYKAGITYEDTHNRNSVVVSYHWHHPRYISLVSFKFRWQGDNEWIQKKRKLRDINCKIAGIPFLEAVEANPKAVDDYMHSSDEIFSPACYEALGYKKSDFLYRHQEYTRSPKFRFGKHKGKAVAWVADNDIDYLQWLVDKYDDKDSWFYGELAQALASRR